MANWYTSVKRIGRKKQRQTREQNHVVVRCTVCGQMFRAARAHATCCSVKCRVAKCRKSA